MDLFKSDWLHDPARTGPAAARGWRRRATTYGSRGKAPAPQADAGPLLRLRHERATLWELARRDRVA